MIKALIKKINLFKDFIGRYIPSTVKTEAGLMKKGMNSIINRYDNMYCRNYALNRIHGETSVNASINSCFSSLGRMRIKRDEIPAAVGLVAGLAPIPASSGVGYALARVATCDKAMVMYHTGGHALKSAYSAVNNMLLWV